MRDTNPPSFNAISFNAINPFNGEQKIWKNLTDISFYGWIELPKDLILGCSSKGLFLLDQRTMSTTKLQDGDIHALAFLKNSSIACSLGGLISIFDLDHDFQITKSQVMKDYHGNARFLFAVGEQLLLIGEHTSLELWDWNAQTRIRKFNCNHEVITNVVLINDSSFVTYYKGWQDYIQLWNVEDHDHIKTITLPRIY